MTKEKFSVTGMSCSACSAHVEKSVSALTGVQEVTVNLLTNSMQVEYDETSVSEKDIVKAVKKGGYGAAPDKAEGMRAAAAEEALPESAAALKQMKFRFLFSLCFLIPLMYLSMHHMFWEWFGLPVPSLITRYFHGTENAVTDALTQLLLLLPIVFANQKYYRNGFPSLFRGHPNMDSLIAIGSGAAILYGIFALYRIGFGLGHGDLATVEHYSMDLYFESAGTILTLITLGKYLETKSKGRTGEAITKLIGLTPKTALVVRDGEEVEVPVGEILVGDCIAIKPGASIPVDGVITEGSTSIDESAITGESIPVEKKEGDSVISATVNKTGYFRFQATKVGEDTTISQIVRLVEEASASKAPIARLADKISGIFVPTVIAIALIASVVWLLLGATAEFALSIGISVLVISCPCALGLATPVAIMVGTGKGAENGILIKSGEALETAHSIDTVVLDKTGTITQGTPKITDVIPLAASAEKLLAVAYSLEKQSEHPLAEAVVAYAEEQGCSPPPSDEFQAVFVRGISASIEVKKYFAGNLAYVEELGIARAEEHKELWETVARLADEGKTPLLFADKKDVLGLLAAADVIKPTSEEAIKAFRELGVQTVMLTGDNARTAEAIRKKLNIPEVISEVLPQDKERKIAEFQSRGKKVAMIGDGVNDAPALTRADVGIAIGAGSDIAIESADIVLVKSDLLDAVTAIRLSRAVMLNIKENLFWAFFYNSIGIPLAAGALFFLGLRLNPMFGAAAMSLSSVCVVSNALRLKFFKPTKRRA